MLIRPLEFVWNEWQKGFSLMSFAFPDDSYYSFLGIIYLRENKAWWFSLAFYGCIVGGDDSDFDFEDD